MEDAARQPPPLRPPLPSPTDATASAVGRVAAQPVLLADLLMQAAERDPHAPALTAGARTWSYAELAELVRRAAGGLVHQSVARGDRVAVWLDKRVETVALCFAAAQAGAVFVPINPLLKPQQVAHILRDSGAVVLLTTPERVALLDAQWGTLPALRQLLLTGAEVPQGRPAGAPPVVPWAELVESPMPALHRVIDSDATAILYTSGSTGAPKGVVLSHRNMVVGACSVAGYLDNCPADSLLAVLPLSFDAGFSQLTTAFRAGARVVLLNHLLPRDVLQAMERERITGLTAVPPLYQQLAQSEWPHAVGGHLRYFASTGGRMPPQTLAALRRLAPRARPFLMYGLTEAFRSTYLPPEEVDRRPQSIGRAIPDAQVLVLREDGSECGVDEPGELVHCGPLVAQGYWGDAEKTAERFRPLPAGLSGRAAGLQVPTLPELAVFSGDTVRRDAAGFLYFVGRRDEMIKTSGYRVSPHEVEAVVQASGLVGECAAFGVDDAALGQTIHVAVTVPVPVPGDPAAARSLDTAALLNWCRSQLPAYMVPASFSVQTEALPRNPNGKIDRKLLSSQAGSQSDPSHDHAKAAASGSDLSASASSAASGLI